MPSEANYRSLLGDIEIHNVEAISKHFASGIDPNDTFDDGYHNKSLIDYMISMYMRSSRFSACIKAFFKYGLDWDDDFLKAILLNDTSTLEFLLMNDHDLIHNRYDIDNAYTFMTSVSALHICAEFNLVGCAKILLNSGVSVDVKAGTDEFGFGLQTPIFHTVNQNGNASSEMLDLLLNHGADLTHTVKGINWGRGYPWETLYPAVNPISYAMMGLSSQMHRNPITVKDTVQKLLRAAYKIDYHFPNVPCAYLES